MEGARNSGAGIVLVGPVRPRAVLGAGPVDGHKNSAPEKERHTPVEGPRAASAPEAAPNGGRPDRGVERLQILDAKGDRTGSTVERRIDGGQRKRRGRTIETG